MSRATVSAMLALAAVPQTVSAGAELPFFFSRFWSPGAQPLLLSTAGFASASRVERHLRTANPRRGGGSSASGRSQSQGVSRFRERRGGGVREWK